MDNLKKVLKIIVMIISLILIICAIFFYKIATDEDKIEYPLAMVDVDDTSEYMLIKAYDTYEVITETQLIKENASDFKIYNRAALYGTTADGLISLYKDGELIDSVIFDVFPYTKKIEYGTLHFREVNGIQYRLLIGYKIVEQGENYCILFNNKDEYPYYYCFAHIGDLHSLETVSLVASDGNLDEIPKPQKIGDDIVEFSAYYPTYAGDETAHWYFRLSDCKLSQRYLNVKAIQGNRIVCTDSNYIGPKIIVCDMFDEDAYYTEITGDFSKEADRLFLLSAEFTADGNICAEYIGNDSQIHIETFLLP